MVEVAKSKVTLMIQTAGNYGSVAQNTNLIPQTVAEYTVTAVSGGQIRPVKLVAAFQVYPVTQPGAFSFYSPGLGEEFFHMIKDLLIPFLRPAMIPQAEYGQNLSLCGFSESETAPEVFLKGNSQIICFKGMEGNIDLVQGRGAEKYFLLFCQQSAVGGENYFESGICGKLQKFFQMGMQQRFSIR